MKHPATEWVSSLALGRVLHGAPRMLWRYAFACLAFTANGWTGMAHAGSFTVNPVRVELSAAAPTAVVQVENTQSAPITIQMSTMAWSQPGGKDELKATRDIIATPQIFTLKPGATQVVRIGMLRKPDIEQEAGYRLLLEEIPAPPAPDFKGLRVALRISLPVFVKPLADIVPALSATFQRDEARQLRLTLANHGKATAQLHGLTLHPDHHPLQTLAEHPSSVYVLPGQTRQLSFPLSAPLPEESLLIKATMQGAPLILHARPFAQ